MFVVDGDRATPTEAYSSIDLTHAARAQVIAAAGVLEADPRGDIELVVGIDAGLVAGSGAWHELGMRAVVDESGGIASWRCSAIDDPAREVVPCGL